MMSFEQERRVPAVLNEAQRLLRQLEGPLVLSPPEVHVPEAPQNREALRAVFEAIAQLEGPEIAGFDLARGVALRRHHSGAEGHADAESFRERVVALRERFQQR